MVKRLQTQRLVDPPQSLASVTDLEHWIPTFTVAYDQAVERYTQGYRGPDQVSPGDALSFLASIGTAPQELYDFVEDWVDAGEPSLEEVI